MNNDEEREHFRDKYAPSAKLSLDEEWTQHNISERIIKGCAKGDSFSLDCVDFNDWAADVIGEARRLGVDERISLDVKTKLQEYNLKDLIVRDEMRVNLATVQRKGWWESKTFEPRQAIEHLNHYLPQ
jgi:hypothetical protein